MAKIAPSVAVPSTLVLAGMLVAVGSGCANRDGSASGAGASATADGAELFAAHCAVCHGEQGKGDGPAAIHLTPPPRDLSRGRFALVSGRTSGKPTREDLMQVLERGMPGSAMPSFAFLGEAARAALVDHICEDVTLADSSDVIGEPPHVADTPEHRARGAELYAQHCASCHGAEGRGGMLAPPDATEVPLGLRTARDFRSGVLRGPVTRTDLARRILAGMPAAGMPPTFGLDDTDVAALVDHLMRWIPEDAARKLVQSSDQLEVPYVDRVPSDADDPAFPESSTLVLSPLAWSPGAVRSVEVSAVHDEDEIALRLRWADATPDRAAVDGDGASALPDAVAVQWGVMQGADASAPPLLTMGGGTESVDVWQWQAFRPDELVGYLDAHGVGGGIHHDMPRLPARGVVSTEQRARVRSAKGPPRFGRFVNQGIEIDASASHDGERWTVVLRRSLRPQAGEAVDLRVRPDNPVVFTLAAAVWNGSAQDRRGDKSISTWQRVRLLGRGE